jgi:hypothetical protein
LLVEVLIARGNLQLHDLIPQIVVGIEVECAHGDVAILTRVGPDDVRGCNQADGLLELVAPRDELLACAPERPVDPVPGERAMPDAGFALELRIEPALPPRPVPGRRRIVEQEKVAPVELRVARRSDDEISVPALEDAVDAHHVDVGRPHERVRNRRLAHVAGLGVSCARAA